MDKSWFDTMAADAKARPDLYKRLGFADLRLVVEEQEGEATKRYGLVLDGYDVIATGEVDDVASFAADAVLSGSRAAWDELASNIVSHDGADSAHTLNSLTIAETPLRVSSPDPVGRDKFFRYAETLQTLFDSLASLSVAA